MIKYVKRKIFTKSNKTFFHIQFHARNRRRRRRKKLRQRSIYTRFFIQFNYSYTHQNKFAPTIWNRSEVNFEFDNDSPVECAFWTVLTLHPVETVTNCTRARDAHRNCVPPLARLGFHESWNWRKQHHGHG